MNATANVHLYLIVIIAKTPVKSMECAARIAMLVPVLHHVRVVIVLFVGLSHVALFVIIQ